MQLNHQALQESKQIRTLGHPSQGISGDPVLGLEKNKKHKQDKPSVIYKFSNSNNFDALNKAFDILFEETLKKSGNLTSYDNLV